MLDQMGTLYLVNETKHIGAGKYWCTVSSYHNLDSNQQQCNHKTQPPNHHYTPIYTSRGIKDITTTGPHI